MSVMRVFLTSIVISYALFGNIALTGVSIVPPTLAAQVPSFEEVSMTLASEEDLAMTLLSPRLEEQGNQHILTCGEQGQKAVQLPGTREACPTDRCIAAFEDQAKIEGGALLSGKQEVPLPAAAALAQSGEVAGSVKNVARVGEGRKLIAIITSSVVFRE
jgi:hypothetical protein